MACISRASVLVVGLRGLGAEIGIGLMRFSCVQRADHGGHSQEFDPRWRQVFGAVRSGADNAIRPRLTGALIF